MSPSFLSAKISSLNFVARGMASLAAATVGAACAPEEETAAVDFYHAGPRQMEKLRSENITGGVNRALLPAPEGQGCLSVVQENGTGQNASLYSLYADGSDFGYDQIPGSDRGTVRHALWLGDGEFALSLSSDDAQSAGVLVRDASGVGFYHDFVAHGFGVPGVMAQNSGEIAVLTGSAVVSFDPRQYPPEYRVIDLGVTGAGGLASVGDRLIVSAAGAYGESSPAVLELERDGSGNFTVVAQAQSYQDLAGEGRLDVLDDFALLPGTNHDSLVGIYRTDSDEADGVVAKLNLPPDREGERAVGVQWLFRGATEGQIALSSFDPEEQKLFVQVASGDFATGSWAIDQSWAFFAQSAVGLLEYAPQLYCVATHNGLVYFQAN